MRIRLPQSRTARALIATAAAGLVLGISGFAIAAFVQPSSSGAVNGSAESFAPTTVTGVQTKKLLPGESADVTLTFSNPNPNVKAQLKSVESDSVVVYTVSNTPEDNTYCKDLLHTSASGAPALLPTLNENESNVPFVLSNAVTLDDLADIRCQGMTYETRWTVKFQAVR